MSGLCITAQERRRIQKTLNGILSEIRRRYTRPHGKEEQRHSETDVI